MSSATDALNVAQGVTTLTPFARLRVWVGNATVVWTAWSVLAELKSVQDVIQAVSDIVHSINVNLGWAVDLIIFLLLQAAAGFHFVADRLFGWIPFFVIPEEYHEAAIVSFLALAPTLIAIGMLALLSSGYNAAFEFAGRYRFIAEGDVRRYESNMRWYQSRQDNPREHLPHRPTGFRAQEGWKVGAEEVAGTFMAVRGFRAFSLRSYVSVLLCLALTAELWYSGAWQSDEALTTGIVWLIVGVSLVLGWGVRNIAQRAERKHGVEFAHSLALVHSLPLIDSDYTDRWGNRNAIVLPVMLYNPGGRTRIFRAAHVIANDFYPDADYVALLEAAAEPDGPESKLQSMLPTGQAAAGLNLWLWLEAQAQPVARQWSKMEPPVRAPVDLAKPANQLPKGIEAILRLHAKKLLETAKPAPGKSRFAERPRFR